MSVPVIDLERADAAAAIDLACREVGFFSIVGHGLDPRVVDAAHGAARAFFDLPLDDRMEAVMPEAGYPYGYHPFSGEALNRSIGGRAPADLKETFNVGPVDPPSRSPDEMTDPDERAVHSPNLWPSALPVLRPAIEAYYREMADLAATLMDHFASALGLGAGWFDPFIDRHGSALRLAHYPALPEAPAPGSVRAGAHTDYGTLTILRLDDEPGLQVRSPAGRWQDVEAPDGAFVINLGDLMQRWTNDRWRSTMHRVVIPDGRWNERRLTMPFFHNANWDARIECIVTDGDGVRHPPVSAGAHLMRKFRSTVTSTVT